MEPHGGRRPHWTKVAGATPDGEGDHRMQPDIRRIVAVDAHRRKTGRCPTVIHSLGTGESFRVEPTTDGFIDLQSGRQVRCEMAGIVLPDINTVIDTGFTGDVTFSGFDPLSRETFFGRAGGGVTVTVYDEPMVDYFQYAVAEEPDDYAASSGTAQAS
jgi:hypothetical protein